MRLVSLTWLIFLVGQVVGKTTKPEPTTVKCMSTKGAFEIEVFVEWSPIGAAHFLKLVKEGFFSDIPLFRNVPNFLVQFGVNGDPKINSKYENIRIKDDPNTHMGFKRGMVSYAGSGPDSRTTQLFIAFGSGLGSSPWETPIGIVSPSYMDSVVDKWYSGYGDLSIFGGKGPDPSKIAQEGSAYLKKSNPKLDYIQGCRIVSDPENTNGKGKRKSESEAKQASEPTPLQITKRLKNAQKARTTGNPSKPAPIRPMWDVIAADERRVAKLLEQEENLLKEHKDKESVPSLSGMSVPTIVVIIMFIVIIGFVLVRPTTVRNLRTELCKSKRRSQ